MNVNTEDLLCIIYVSKSIEPLNDEKLTKILTISQECNSKHDITGILLYNDSNFMQVLEGPSAETLSLFEKIKMDKRHKNVHQVVCKKIKSKSFSKWSMAFRSADKIFFEQIQIEAFNDPPNTRLLPDNPKPDNSVLSLIKIFVAVNPII